MIRVREQGSEREDALQRGPNGKHRQRKLISARLLVEQVEQVLNSSFVTDKSSTSAVDIWSASI